MRQTNLPMTEVAAAFIAHARSLLMTDYLPKIERCLERLTDEDVWWRAHEESNSIGNLLLHLAGNARQWIVSGVGHRSRDRRVRQEEFDERAQLPRAELLARLEQTLDEAGDDAGLVGADHLDGIRMGEVEVPDQRGGGDGFAAYRRAAITPRHPGERQRLAVVLMQPRDVDLKHPAAMR